MSLASPAPAGLRWLLLAVVALLALPGVAGALPSDRPVESLSPGDGATVPAAAIVVTFACPRYEQDRSGDPAAPTVETGASADYGVRFSGSSTLGSDGRLADSELGGAGPSVRPDGSCSSPLVGRGGARDPTLVGGRVYWQVSRSCSGCPSGYESGPVRSFVAEVSVEAELRLPKRIYARYPALISVASSARLGAAAAVILERRAGGRWRPVVREPFHAEVTKLVARLPAGRQSIRVVVSTGAARTTGPARAVTVLREGRRATSRRDDGRYRARPAKKGTTLSFSVVRGGRELRAFKASVPASCVGPSLEANRIVLAQAALSRALVAPDGAVVQELRVRGARELLTGRLRRGRFVGRIDVQFANCEGSRSLSARMRLAPVT